MFLTARLTDEALSIPNMSHHYQKLLNNCIKNLINGIPGDTMSVFGDVIQSIKFNFKGFVQPHYMFECKTKLHNMLKRTDYDLLIDEETLLREREDTILDNYKISQKDFEDENKIINTNIYNILDQLGLVVQPNEITLDMEYSHPVIDTCNFKQINGALQMRQKVINYILRNPWS